MGRFLIRQFTVIISFNRHYFSPKIEVKWGIFRDTHLFVGHEPPIIYRLMYHFRVSKRIFIKKENEQKDQQVGYILPRKSPYAHIEFATKLTKKAFALTKNIRGLWPTMNLCFL